MWNNLNVPKHSSVSWLIVLNKLSNREKLADVGVCNDTPCLLYVLPRDSVMSALVQLACQHGLCGVVL